MRGAIAPVSESPIAFSACKRSFARVGPNVAFIHVFVGKMSLTVATLVNIVPTVEIHVHSNVISTSIHFITSQTNVSVARVRQSVNHELLFNLRAVG